MFRESWWCNAVTFEKEGVMLFGKFLKGMFGAGRVTKDVVTGASIEDADFRRALDHSCRRRQEYWTAVGGVESELYAPLINARLQGSEANWPAYREAYRIVRRGSSTIIATDGLSDPFEGTTGLGNGFEVELFLETPDPLGELPTTWAFALIRQLARQMAGSGGLGTSLADYGVLSMEFPDVADEPRIHQQVPSSFVTADGSVGVLLGQPLPGFATTIPEMPLSPVIVLPIVLLTAREVSAVRDGKGSARDEIVGLLAEGSSRHQCVLGRSSVV